MLRPVVHQATASCVFKASRGEVGTGKAARRWPIALKTGIQEPGALKAGVQEMGRPETAAAQATVLRTTTLVVHALASTTLSGPHVHRRAA